MVVVQLDKDIHSDMNQIKKNVRDVPPLGDF